MIGSCVGAGCIGDLYATLNRPSLFCSLESPTTVVGVVGDDTCDYLIGYQWNKG